MHASHATSHRPNPVVLAALLLATLGIGVAPAPAAATHGGIVLTKTVIVDATPGIDNDGVCGTQSSIQVAEGTVVDYCFRIENHDDVTLNSHTLVDDEFGLLLDDFAYNLVPGATAFLTRQAVVNRTATRSATWTATNGGVTHSDSGSASVTVNGPALTLTMGVAIDLTPGNVNDDGCSTLPSIQVPATSAGTPVDYCFEIRNNTNQRLDRHDLVATGFGAVLDDFGFILVPGATAFITQQANVTYRNDKRSGTWTARNEDESYDATDNALVTVLLPYTDIASSKFLGDIVWLDEQAITVGCSQSPPRFCAEGLVTRAQMATFLTRALDLPPASRDHFTDDKGNKHEDRINRLADAGITVGCSATRFCPDGLVTRAQMATFLTRAFDLPSTATDFFDDDDGNKHEARINAIASADITHGCGTDRFCPNGVVTRGQMAAFLHRADD